MCWPCLRVVDVLVLVLALLESVWCLKILVLPAAAALHGFVTSGESGVDQLVEIIKVLGTPTKEEIHAMNPNYTEFKFPQIKPHPWTKVFSKRMPPDAIDLVRPAAGLWWFCRAVVVYVHCLL